MLEAETPADEVALMIDTHLGRIARIVEDFHLLPHKGGERRFHVAPPLKPDSVAQHLPGPCDLQKQHVEGFEAFGHVRQEPIGLPSHQRCLAGAAMPPGMISCKKRFKLLTEVSHGQRGGAWRLPPDQSSWQISLEDGVKGAEEPFDPAPAGNAPA